MPKTGAFRDLQTERQGDMTSPSSLNRVFLVPMAMFCLCCLPCFSQPKVTLPKGFDDLGVPAAIERARKGDSDELLRITLLLGKQPRLLPPQKALGQYHEYLRDENVFVQCFAVQVIAGLKHKSSFEPLRQCIMDLERRQAKADALSDKERMALGLASTQALAAIGEIDADNSLAVKFLAGQLDHDIPMEWGGGFAHYALAKKGRLGLRVLMEEAATIAHKGDYDKQACFLADAIHQIRDPELAVDLYALCRNPKYHKAARWAALWRLGYMGISSPEIEQMVIDVAKDEKSDIRSVCFAVLGHSGTPRMQTVLYELEKTLPANTEGLQQGLLELGDENRLKNIIQRIIAAETRDEEKRRFWGLLTALPKEKLRPQAERLCDLLRVYNDQGRPFNDLRTEVWCKLFELTKVRYPIVLDFDSEARLAVVSSFMVSSVRFELTQEYDGKGTYTYSQIDQMARDEVRKLVTKWESSNRN